MRVCHVSTLFVTIPDKLEHHVSVPWHFGNCQCKHNDNLVTSGRSGDTTWWDIQMQRTRAVWPGFFTLAGRLEPCKWFASVQKRSLKLTKIQAGDNAREDMARVSATADPSNSNRHSAWQNCQPWRPTLTLVLVTRHYNWTDTMVLLRSDPCRPN